MIAEVTQVRTTVWSHFQARFAEWLNAAVLFAWGAYLILHPGMMQDPRVSALWTGMLVILSQPTWGMVALIGGTIRGMALYVNGAHRRTPLIRLVTSFVSMFILTQIVLGLWNASTPNTGLIVYPALLLADIYSAFRASADLTFVAKQSQEKQVAEPGRVVDIAQRNAA